MSVSWLLHTNSDEIHNLPAGKRAEWLPLENITLFEGMFIIGNSEAGNTMCDGVLYLNNSLSCLVEECSPI